MAKNSVPEDTPLIRQFFEVKAQYPEAILLYRVGDFYETYSDDALVAAKVLGIVQTRKSNGDKPPVAMAGFPHHALEVYLPKLVRAGYKVAVCDQLEDPKLTGRKLVKRGVTDLVTPGVAFGESMLEQKQNNFLAGLTWHKDTFGLALVDVSTGSFQVAQGSKEYIATLISTLAPKEIVVSRGDEKYVREQFGDDLYVSTVEEWAFVYDAAVNRLCKQLNVESLKGYAVEGFPLALCAAGALLVYLEQTCHAGLKNICSIGRIDEGKFVWMDKFTLRNLEVFQSAAPDGVSLIGVVDRCNSPMGARLLRTWLAMPVMDLDELKDRYDIVDHFLARTEDRADLQGRIGDIGDLDRILARAAAGKIAPREVRQLGRGLAQTGPLRSLCSGKGVDALDRLVGQLQGSDTLCQEIFRTLAAEPAAQLGKGDVIGEGVDPELDELRRIAHGGKQYLLEMQQRESERTGIPSLKISYNNVFGYYLEVRNTYKDKVPPEWVRKQTLVGAERYITQELKEYEEKILGAEERIYALESKLYGELVAHVQDHIAAIQSDARIIARLDVLAGFAELAADRHYCRPEMTGGLELDIKAGRHPVIETLMKPGEEYIPNDIHLDADRQQIIILTGPNMAGKSALLRQTALIVLLAQAGCFVPADAARIGWFDKIFTRVGATDNISRGESTFMVEMLETSMILHNLSQRSLVLLDEIGRGTSTYDGMSIARAIVEYIHEYGKGAKTLFATHYHELNDLAALYPRVKNFHVSVKEVGKQVLFLRKLAEGGSAHSFGIHVARLAGMPREVLDSAEKTLAALEAADPAALPAGETPPTVADRPGVRTARKDQFGKIRKAYNIPEGTVESDGSIQLSLFQLDDPTLSSLRARLEGADLNNITPLQAFDMLRDMKKELGI